MAIPTRFNLIQQVTAITDDDILAWAREIENLRDEEFKKNINPQLISVIKNRGDIMDALVAGGKVEAIQILRKSGLTDKGVRNNKLIIEAVMETL